MWPYTIEETETWSMPRGDLASRVLAMPADTNPAGDIFGGWIMSLMDSSGAMAAASFAHCRVVTVAVTDMSFHHPVKVGDTVCCYAALVRVGRTSLTYHIEVWVLRAGHGTRTKVTEAEFTFVCVDESGEPRLLPVASTEHAAASGEKRAI
jgi:acyl-CoA thioesterase YciA